MAAVGFVVVEYNQASGQPDLRRVGVELHFNLVDAEAEREHLRSNTAFVGRRETYAIAEVVIIDIDEKDFDDGLVQDVPTGGLL